MSDETTKDLTDNLSDRDLLLKLVSGLHDVKAELNVVNRRVIAVEQALLTTQEQTARLPQIAEALVKINATLRGIRDDRANDREAHYLLEARVAALETKAA